MERLYCVVAQQRGPRGAKPSDWKTSLGVPMFYLKASSSEDAAKAAGRLLQSVSREEWHFSIGVCSSDASDYYSHDTEHDTGQILQQP